MKRTIIIAVFLLTAALLFAQDYEEKFLKNQGLTDDQIAKLSAIQEQSRDDIQKARAEINVAKARLAQLLLAGNPDMSQVEKTVREAGDLEVRIKMTQIRQEIAIRKLLGDTKWRELTKALRQKKAAAEAAAEKKTAGRNLSKDEREKALQLLKELRQTLGDSQP
jgi:G:T/U-mismatch repair DNA glycosylase